LVLWRIGAVLRAVLDACVLIPAALRDILLRAAGAGLYQVFWSDEILDEVRRNLISQLGRSEDDVERLTGALRAYFPEATVTDFGALIDTMTNDPNDRHVVAAAAACEAGVIVTSNLRDFPASALAPHGIEAQSPDDFLLALAMQHAEQMIQLITEQASDLQQPPKSVPDVLQMIARQAPRFAAWAAKAHRASADS
jgi:predicted nucleic acid-binding protein